MDGDLANGAEAYYDTTLNITWLRDADYAKTSGYDADGLMYFTEAKAWASQLKVGGIGGWRLPKITDPTLPCAIGWSTPNCGFNPEPGSSEMASMFFDTLDNIGMRDSVGGWRPGVSGVDFGIVNTGPFLNLQNDNYWFGTPYQFDYYDDGWHFDFRDGLQGFVIKEYDFCSWAVHDGDVGLPINDVPEPDGVLLTLTGAAALALSRRASFRAIFERKNQQQAEHLDSTALRDLGLDRSELSPCNAEAQGWGESTRLRMSRHLALF